MIQFSFLSLLIKVSLISVGIGASFGFSFLHLPPRSRPRGAFRSTRQMEFKSSELRETSAPGIEFPGKHKWLGGAVDEEGRIYGVPSNAKEVICLAPNPADGDKYEIHTIKLPISIAEGEFKWLRGIIWKNFLIGKKEYKRDYMMLPDGSLIYIAFAFC